MSKAKQNRAKLRAFLRDSTKSAVGPGRSYTVGVWWDRGPNTMDRFLGTATIAVETRDGTEMVTSIGLWKGQEAEPYITAKCMATPAMKGQDLREAIVQCKRTFTNNTVAWLKKHRS